MAQRLQTTQRTIEKFMLGITEREKLKEYN